MELENRPLRDAPNGARASSAEEWIERSLDKHYQFTRHFLRDQGWLVVPVESGCHFDKQDAKRLARAVTILGKTKLRAVCLEDLNEVRNHLEIDATEQSILLFHQECALFNFALIPDDYSFAVICTVYDYFLVAGGKKFVEIATGKEVAEARSDFEEFASDDSWDDRTRIRLLEISRRYEEA